MNSVIASLLIVCLLPVICSWISGYYRHKQLGSIDNKEPRLQASQLTGAGGRAVAAQGNCWEALGVFTAAILAVSLSGIGMERIANLAMAFAALRIAYVPLYVGNIDWLRSLVFLVGYGICLYFFYLALSAV